MWLMDEMPAPGILQRDSRFQFTWQGHWGKIIGFSVAGSPCKCKRSGILYLRRLTTSSLALVPVAEEFDFCLYESFSGHSRQQLHWHIAAIQYLTDLETGGGCKVGPAVFVFLYHRGLSGCMAHKRWLIPWIKPTGSQSARGTVQR